MAELTDYEVQQIKNHISSFNSAYSTLSRTVERASFDSEISAAQSVIDRYLRDASDAKSKASSCIRSSLDGSGFFFHSNGFNDVIKEKVKAAADEAEKIIREYDSTIGNIIKSISTADSVFASGAIFEASEYDEEHQYAFFTEDSKPTSKPMSSTGVFTPMEPSSAQKEDVSYFEAVFVEPAVGVMESDTPHKAVSTSREKETIVDSLSSILSEDELSGKKQTAPATKSEPTKRVVISKNTHLDNDEIKKLYLSRHADYCLTLEELNKAIEVVGNDLDKDAILFEATIIRFFDYIPSFDYFYCYTTLSRAINIGIKQQKYDAAFELLCGLFFLETSGYLMAHSKYMERRSIGETIIDPRLTSKTIEELNKALSITDNTITNTFCSCKFVVELYKSMPKPLFTIENSAKLMIKAFKEPYEFLNCKNLGVPYNA